MALAVRISGRTLARYALITILLASAGMKVVFPAAAGKAIWVSPVVSVGITLWEVAAGLALWFRPFAVWPLWGCMGFAIGALGIWALSPGTHCGCFGRVEVPRGVHLLVVTAVWVLCVWLLPGGRERRVVDCRSRGGLGADSDAPLR